MNIGDFLQAATRMLTAAGIQTARLDTLVLLSDTLGQDKAAILAHPEQVLSSKQLKHLDTQIAQRAKHTPLAYIRGKAMFYGREFIVSPAVLTPRPETESIIELLLGLSLPPEAQIADIGTGSGCIGLTVALELPRAHVDLYDIDEAALKIASQNNSVLKAGANVIKNDLLSTITRHYDVIVSNLPYVPVGFPVNKAAEQEPAIALFSGVDGLDLYRKFWTQIGRSEDKPQFVITESFPSQHHTLAMLARHAGFALENSQGFVQLFSRM